MTARLAAYHTVGPLDIGQSCDAEFINAKLTSSVTYATPCTSLPPQVPRTSNASG